MKEKGNRREGKILTNALNAAKKFVDVHFPLCQAAILSGSTANGKETATSDLDIVIIQKETNKCRTTFYFDHWPVEVFIQTEESLPFYFQIEQEEGIPLLIRMCAEGLPLRGIHLTQEIQNIAKEHLEAGPTPWSEKKINDSRYIMTYLLEDLEGSNHLHENIFTLQTLIDQVIVFYLRAHRHWTGEGKWAYRSLQDVNEGFAKRLGRAITRFHKTRKKGELIKMIDQVMAPYGGRYFLGYSE